MLNCDRLRVGEYGQRGLVRDDRSCRVLCGHSGAGRRAVQTFVHKLRDLGFWEGRNVIGVDQLLGVPFVESPHDMRFSCDARDFCLAAGVNRAQTGAMAREFQTPKIDE